MPGAGDPRRQERAGVVEPAYDIAGDTFDDAVNGNSAHAAIIDAAGHGIGAAWTAKLAVSASRHSRRRDRGPFETYRAVDRMLADQFGQEKFATAQVVTLTLPTGELCWLNAGHPAPMLIRNGHRIDLVSEISLPIGLARSDGADRPAWHDDPTAVERNRTRQRRPSASSSAPAGRVARPRWAVSAAVGCVPRFLIRHLG